ncbi:MAG: hypothetical protein KAI76_06475 [Alphaproteobacteria bacterium]|nr:hypothetical protein [Alphaproteobacteria bacterium]
MQTEKTSNRISHAITFRPGKNFSDSSSFSVGIPDHKRALFQHMKYCEALKKNGMKVTILSADSTLSGNCFIGSIAIVTENLAIIGTFSDDNPRQMERKAVASALAGSKILKLITAPGLLDCRDALQINDHFYISLSDRTNQEGAAQLAFFLREYGYKITMLAPEKEFRAPLNTTATYLGKNRLLIREELTLLFPFLGYEKIVVPYKERGAVNALMANDTLILPAGYTETSDKIRQLRISLLEVNISEFEKTNGGINCLSIRSMESEAKSLRTKNIDHIPEKEKMYG